MTSIGGSTIAAVALSRPLDGKVAQGLALEGKKTRIESVAFSPHILLSFVAPQVQQDCGVFCSAV